MASAQAHPLSGGYPFRRATPAECDPETPAEIPPGARECRARRALRFQNLHHGFVKMARRKLRKIAVRTCFRTTQYFKALVGCIVFARNYARA